MTDIAKISNINIGDVAKFQNVAIGSLSKIMSLDISLVLTWSTKNTVATARDGHTLTTSYSDIYTSDLSITLASTSSKVLVIQNTHELKMECSSSGKDMEAGITIKRTTSGDTFDAVGVARSRVRDNNSNAGKKVQHQVTITYVDSGFSNLTNTYNAHGKRESSDLEAWCYHNQLILIEIGA